MRPLGLVERFALRSLVIVAAMAIALSYAVTRSVENMVVSQAGDSAQLAVATVIADHLPSKALLSDVLDDDVIIPLRQEIDEHLPSEIAAIKIWNTEAQLVYSSDRSDPIGRAFDDNASLDRALRGEVVAKVESESETESAQQFAEHGNLLEVYAPLYDSATGEVIGVFETYEAYATAAQGVGDANLTIIGIIALGSIVVYLTQVRMVQGAAHQLRETEDLVRTVNARLHDSMREIEEHSLGTLQALTSAVDAKDSYTARHSLNVTDYAVAVGRRLELRAEDISALERASLLHDIGKIGVPESILLKPARLSPEERSVIEEHGVIGARIIESIPFLVDLVPIVRSHHERWDGEGYPDGLQGEQIPRLSRILAVADAFDAMTSNRPYRNALRISVARQELMKYRGIQFDPEVVDAFFQAMDLGEVVVAGHPEASSSARESISA